jgi:hypothetical protein
MAIDNTQIALAYDGKLGKIRDRSRIETSTVEMKLTRKECDPNGTGSMLC